MATRHAQVAQGLADDYVLEEVGRQLAATPSCLVAFSGGIDSTALAWALARLRQRRPLTVSLAHLDHGLDPDSAARAVAAEGLAEKLELPIVVERAGPRPAGTSLEAWARQERYRFLHRVAEKVGARSIATAHHADDQAETVLLRLLFGSGLEGLSAIRARRGLLIRPLLRVRRFQLQETIRAAGLEVAEDPTNADHARPRNRIRHLILPHWQRRHPELVQDLSRLAETAARATGRLDSRLGQMLGIAVLKGDGASLDRCALEALPEALLPHALSALERKAGRVFPTAARARHELMRQMRPGIRIGCDAGEGWRWQGDSRQLRLLRPQKPMPRFTYTVPVPGSVIVAELGTLLRIAPARPGRAATTNRADRALVRLPSDSGIRIEVRNRRPGDRLRPAGRHSEKRLKELLIDRRVPRDQRDRLPLLVVDGRVAWIPGIALDQRFLARDDEAAWLVELRPVTGSPSLCDPNDERGNTP